MASSSCNAELSTCDRDLGPAKPENTVFTVWCLDGEFATARIRSGGITPRCVNPAVSPLFSSCGHVAISFLREFAVFS